MYVLLAERVKALEAEVRELKSRASESPTMRYSRHEYEAGASWRALREQEREKQCENPLNNVRASEPWQTKE